MDCAACKPQQRGATFVLAGSVVVVGFMKRKRSVADDPLLVPGGIARVARLDERGYETAPLRDRQQPADRRRTAGLLVIDARLQAQDRSRGGGVALPCFVVAVVVGQVG